MEKKQIVYVIYDRDEDKILGVVNEYALAQATVSTHNSEAVSITPVLVDYIDVDREATYSPDEVIAAIEGELQAVPVRVFPSEEDEEDKDEKNEDYEDEDSEDSEEYEDEDYCPTYAEEDGDDEDYEDYEDYEDENEDEISEPMKQLAMKVFRMVQEECPELSFEQQVYVASGVMARLSEDE